MFQLYFRNVGLGGLIGLVNWSVNIKIHNIYGYLLFALMMLSFAARLIIAKNFPPIRLKSASLVNAFFIAPIFLYAAFADFMVVVSSLQSLSLMRSPNSSLYGIIVLAGVFGSILTIFLEANLTFKAKAETTPKWTLVLSRIILYIYCALAVSLIWATTGSKMLDNFKSEHTGSGLLYLFIFYFLAIVPFQRHAFLETMMKGKSILHFFISLLIGFGFVAWSVFM